MKVFFRYCFVVMAFLCLFVCGACSNRNISKQEKAVKYREKNPVGSLNLTDIKGNIEICGWGEDFIEINTKKKLNIGLSSDLNLIEPSFYLSHQGPQAQLNIKTRVPARINARIDLTIYVPYSLESIYINQEIGNISIKNYFGDTTIKTEHGSHKVDFQGHILRISALKSRFDINVLCSNSADIVIDGDNTEYNVKFYNLSYQSFCDFDTDNCSINIFVAEHLSHYLAVRNSDSRINIKYKLDNMNIHNYSTMEITGRFGKYPSMFYLDVNAQSGRIAVHKFNVPNHKNLFMLRDNYE